MMEMGSDPQSYLQYLHEHCDCAAAEIRPILEKKIKDLETENKELKTIKDLVMKLLKSEITGIKFLTTAHELLNI